MDCITNNYCDFIIFLVYIDFVIFLFFNSDIVNSSICRFSICQCYNRWSIIEQYYDRIAFCLFSITYLDYCIFLNVWEFFICFTRISFTQSPFKLMVWVISLYSIFWFFVIPTLDFRNFFLVKNTNDYSSSIGKFTISDDYFYSIFSFLFIVNRIFNGQLSCGVNRIICCICYNIFYRCFIFICTNLVICCVSNDKCWFCSIIVSTRNLTNISCIVFFYRTSCIFCMYWFVNVSNCNCVFGCITSTTRIFGYNCNCNFWSGFVIQWFSQFNYTITVNSETRFNNLVCYWVIVRVNSGNDTNYTTLTIFRHN